MKKKQLIIALGMISILGCTGCGTIQEARNTSSDQSQENILTENDADTESAADNSAATDNKTGTDESNATGNETDKSNETDNGTVTDNASATDNGTETDNATATDNASATDNSNTANTSDGQTNTAKTEESIQDEMARVEKESLEYENTLKNGMTQLEMNQTSGQWYHLWDDELNSLWNRLSAELDTDTKQKVLEEQRAWIKRKEQNVRGEGFQGLGGSIQPLLENSTAEEVTRARAYTLAGYLAKERGEEFSISSEMQKSIEEALPKLEDVFQNFEGKWIFDEERNACVGVEKTATCEYGVSGSNWTVWITGGDVLSDLDVWGYTSDSIVFERKEGDQSNYYGLYRNMDNAVCMEYGTSLQAMDDVIVCQ